MEATYAERIKAFEENLEEKNKIAEECVRKWSAERRERLQKKKDERRKRKNELKEKAERRRQKEEQKKSDKEAMRRRMEEEIKEKMKEHEKQRQEMLEKWKQDEKELAKKRYTHIALEEQYQKKVIIPSLERKKEQLRKKREHFQPIRHKDLIDHEKIYVERLKKKLKEKKQKREKWYKEIGYGDYDASKYASKYLSSIENEKLKPLIDPKVEVIEKCDKQKNYAKFVKEMHKPKISVKKKKEMKAIVDMVESSGQSRKLVDKRNKSIGALSELSKNSRPKYENYLRSRPYGGSQSAMRTKWRENPMLPKPKLHRKGIVVDYLLKRRIKRQEHEQDDPDYGRKRRTNWEKVADKELYRVRSNSDPYDDEQAIMPKSRFEKEMKKSEDDVLKQRLEIIKTRAKQIEYEAQEKEKNMKLTNNNNVKASNEINSLLIDSIEAKLHLLKDI